MENEEVVIIAQVMADVDMRYKPEPQVNQLATYLALPKFNRLVLETFDENGRPMFQEEMLFMYRLTYGERQKISSAIYIDFFPDESDKKSSGKPAVVHYLLYIYL